MSYTREISRDVELTIKRFKSTITVTVPVVFIKGETKAVVVRRAALKWLNEYLNKDFPDEKKTYYDNYDIARKKSGVTIKGEVVNYTF